MVVSSTLSAPPPKDGMTRRGAPEHGQAACSTTTGDSGSCKDARPPPQRRSLLSP